MANANPRALMYEKTLTREQYFDARFVSEPLCLFDNCLETDGALACVIVSAERARDARHRPVYVHAFGQGMPEIDDVLAFARRLHCLIADPGLHARAFEPRIAGQDIVRQSRRRLHYTQRW